jgi:hypothetical protein
MTEVTATWKSLQVTSHLSPHPPGAEGDPDADDPGREATTHHGDPRMVHNYMAPSELSPIYVEPNSARQRSLTRRERKETPTLMTQDGKPQNMVAMHAA